MNKHPRFINIKVGPIHFGRWPKEVIKEMSSRKRFERYNMEFWGIGIGGYYIGFMNGRIKRDE